LLFFGVADLAFEEAAFLAEAPEEEEEDFLEGECAFAEAPVVFF
jgi:hypothetical protein